MVPKIDLNETLIWELSWGDDFIRTLDGYEYEYEYEYCRVVYPPYSAMRLVPFLIVAHETG